MFGFLKRNSDKKKQKVELEEIVIKKIGECNSFQEIIDIYYDCHHANVVYELFNKSLSIIKQGDEFYPMGTKRFYKKPFTILDLSIAGPFIIIKYINSIGDIDDIFIHKIELP